MQPRSSKEELKEYYDKHPEEFQKLARFPRLSEFPV